MLAFVQVYPLQPNSKQNTVYIHNAVRANDVIASNTHKHTITEIKALPNAKSFLQSDRQSYAIQLICILTLQCVHKVKRPSVLLAIAMDLLKSLQLQLTHSQSIYKCYSNRNYHNFIMTNLSSDLFSKQKQ